MSFDKFDKKEVLISAVGLKKHFKGGEVKAGDEIKISLPLEGKVSSD